MSLGLSHSLSRHKLKFSPDKVDTMIVQAIALLDDLDKELNTYAMRVKEWYGWHFPELGKMLNDNLAYARVVRTMGMRTGAAGADLAEILPEEIEASVKAAAEVSMGTEITSEDLENIQALAEQVVEFTDYRQQLSGYLSARMAAVAPNLTALVGDLVGARLIAHAGSLMNLAKSPASTIQILGAEKALFRALKTKHDTPKYGLIYHASLIGQASGKNKGKIARVLAAKAAIGLRVDALADWTPQDGDEEPPEEVRAALGNESRLKIERRLAGLEGRPLRPKGVAIAPNGVSQQPRKWEIKEARKYNPDADGLAGDEEAAAPLQGKGTKIQEVEDAPAKAIGAGPSLDSAMKDADKMDENEDSGAEDENESMDGTGDAQEAATATPAVQAKPATAESEDEEETPDEDHEMEDPETPAHETSKEPASNGIPSNGIEPDSDAPSATISTVSADSPESADSPSQHELNWQSAITGNTKVAKKARKKERHERRLATSEVRSADRQERRAKVARRLDRKERRQRRAEQLARREDRAHAELARLAELSGLSVSRYERKLARGEIEFEEDGTPVAVSKKDVKRARKAAEKAQREEGAADAGKKRKREAVEEVEDGAVEKKRKRREKEEKKASKEEKKAMKEEKREKKEKKKRKHSSEAVV